MTIRDKLMLGAIALSLAAEGTALALSQAVDAVRQSNDPASLRAEAFEAAQLAVTTTTAAALARVAASFSKGGDGIARLERERDDLVHRLIAAEKRYLDLLGVDGADKVRLRAEISAEADKLRASIRRTESAIAAADPGYFDLTRPRSLSVSETQALLNTDEAILLLMTGDDATYVFAVSRERIEWARAGDLGVDKLKEKVAALRESLEQVEGAPAFRRSVAHQLYTSLIMPVAAVLEGKRAVMTVADGPLGSLPLHLLVTDPPSGKDAEAKAQRDTHFLIDRHAMTVLPAVSSLLALRCLLVAPERRHPGCGKAAGRVARPSPDGAVLLVGFGAPSLLGDPRTARRPRATRGGPAIKAAFNGTLADTDALRKLAYLPGSRTELDRLSEEFGAKANIFIGDDATETAVKGNAELRRARYVIFSTHGLLAGQMGVAGEPGLVFTPPKEDAKSAVDDGLLSASEAARLQLRADFVVLSACNTAGPDGSSGEGLSGLARAFFYSGARSLLVSHWEVDDLSTAQLILDTFGAFGGSTDGDRAEALRSAMRNIRNKPEWVSPTYWGAFTLVGVPD